MLLGFVLFLIVRKLACSDEFIFSMAFKIASAEKIERSYGSL